MYNVKLYTFLKNVYALKKVLKLNIKKKLPVVHLLCQLFALVVTHV